MKDKKFVYVKLNKTVVQNMISTYEFLAWSNKRTEDGKECIKILKALKKALENGL